MIFEQIRVDGDRNLAYVIGDEGTGANFGAKVALGMKFVESEINGESGNSEIGGQGARGGQARRVIAEVPSDQFVANLTVELLMQWFG